MHYILFWGKLLEFANILGEIRFFIGNFHNKVEIRAGVGRRGAVCGRNYTSLAKDDEDEDCDEEEDEAEEELEREEKSAEAESDCVGCTWFARQSLINFELCARAIDHFISSGHFSHLYSKCSARRDAIGIFAGAPGLQVCLTFSQYLHVKV